MDMLRHLSLCLDEKISIINFKNRKLLLNERDEFVFICRHRGKFKLSNQLGLENTLSAPLQRGKTPTNQYPGYDTKQSDGEVPAVLELWGIWSTPSLPSLPGPLCPGVVATDRPLSMG